MFDRDVPVYLITGFLESGKTQFLDFTIGQSYFHIPEKTLLIVCEEGEEEYDQANLKKNNTVNFNKTNSRDVVKIEINKKEYVIRNNEYFVNKALKKLKTIDEEEVLDSLDYVFDALNYLYGEDVVEDIALNNPNIDWGEFVRFSIAMAAGMTKEQYNESIEEASKNE